jgi:E3 ubiquitin-protein ligase RNF13/E3 ubiquitin-protein ligase RNF167
LHSKPNRPYSIFRPIITFVFILLLPSALTFVTLLIHRVRAARAAQRDRAPQDIVRNLPWRVWTGAGCEKHENHPVAAVIQPLDAEVERGITSLDDEIINGNGIENENDASTSHTSQPVGQPWFEAQVECAICLSEFIKGDKVRVLPCHHIFHLDEVDEWLIQRKKLVRARFPLPNLDQQFTDKHTWAVSGLQSRCHTNAPSTFNIAF